MSSTTLLLLTSLLLCAQVVAIVATKVAVGRNEQRLDIRVHEELGEDRLELRLPVLEVIATSERLLALGKLIDTGHEHTLGGAIHERLALEDGSDGEEGRRRHLGVRGADRSKKAVGRVVHAWDDVTATLGVGSPEHDDTVQLVLSLEATDVGTDVLEISLFISTRENVVGAGPLVGGDEVGIVDRRKRGAKESHVWLHLALELIVEHASTFRGLVHRHTRDVPPSKDKVVRVNHWEHVADWNVDFFGGSGLRTNADGGGTKDGANVVGLLDTTLDVPGDLVLVWKDSSAKRRAVVTTHPDHHEPAINRERDA